jgi:hypothetical protein
MVPRSRILLCRMSLACDKRVQAQSVSKPQSMAWSNQLGDATPASGADINLGIRPGT